MLSEKKIAAQEVPADVVAHNLINATMEINPILVVDGNNAIVYLNKSAQRTFGLIKNNNISEIQTEINLSELLSNFFESSFSNISLNFQINNLFDTSKKGYDAEVEKISLDNKQYLFIVFHLTEKEVILENKINSMHAAIEYANLPIMIIDSNGKVSFLSRSMEKILGFTIDELYEKFFCEPLEHLLSKAEMLTAERAFFLKQNWIKIISFREGDKTLFREFQLTPFINNDEATSAFMLVVHDITDYIQKNIIIKESERKLKSIIDNIRDPLLILKYTKGNFVFEAGNTSFFRVFGIEKTKLLDIDLKSECKNELLKLTLKKAEQLLQDMMPLTDFKAQYNMNHYHCKISLMDISTEDESYIMIMFNNITDQQNYQDKMKAAYQKEVQLNKLKSAFIQNISHEIRTPFNAVAGYAEILEESIRKNNYENASELVVLVKEVMTRVSLLFDRIIDMSEIESGEMLFDYEFLNYNQLLTSAFNKLFEKAKQKGIELLLDLTEQEMIVKIDWVKFEKIIYELTENAIKFTSKGKVVIRSFVLNQMAHITITDTGEGMNQDEINNLLEPFSQEEQGYTRRYQGVGLGLAIASRLTKLMGGLFQIVSRKGTGTKVTLMFPIVKN